MSDRDSSSYEEWIFPDITAESGVINQKCNLSTTEEIQDSCKQSYDEGLIRVAIAVQVSQQLISDNYSLMDFYA